MEVQWRRLAADILGVTAFELMQSLGGALVAGLGGLLTSKVLTHFIADLRPLSAYITAFMVVLMPVLFIAAYVRLSPYWATIPRQTFDFTIKHREMFLHYHARDRATYTKTIVIVPRRKELCVYEDRYCWTGAEVKGLKSLIRGQEAFLTEQRGIWQYYEIRFSTILPKGKPVETKVEMELLGEGRPFLSTSTKEPTGGARLIVKCDKGVMASDIYRETNPTLGAKRPLFPAVGPHELDRNGEHEWPISRPRLLRNYSLRWGWGMRGTAVAEAVPEEIVS